MRRQALALFLAALCAPASLAAAAAEPMVAVGQGSTPGKGGPPPFYGRVTDRDGKPVAEADVWLREAHPPAWRGPVSYGSGATDANGIYRLTGLNGNDLAIPAGVDLVLVADDGGNHPVTFSGGTFRESRATTFRYAVGQSKRVDFRLASCVDATIGYVDTQGKPVILGDFPWPTLYWERSSEPVETTPQNFTFMAYWACVPPGRFTLKVTTPSVNLPTIKGDAWYPGVATQSAASLLTARLGPGSTRWPSITFAAGGIVKGRITGPDGRPVAGALVSTTHGLPIPWQRGFHAARTDADGRYQLTGLPAGDQVLFVGPPEGSDLAAEWSGNASAPEAATAVRITPGTPAGFSAQLAAGHRFRGTVTSAAGAVGGINLQIFTSSGAYLGEASTDDYPAYTGPALPPGSYLIGAGSAYAPMAWHAGAWTSATATRVPLGATDKSLTIRLP